MTNQFSISFPHLGKITAVYYGGIVCGIEIHTQGEISEDLHDDLQGYIEHNGYTLINHCVYKTESGLCLKYSDHVLTIGTCVETGFSD